MQLNLNDISKQVQDTLSLTKGYGEHRSQPQNLIIYLSFNDKKQKFKFKIKNLKTTKIIPRKADVTPM